MISHDAGSKLFVMPGFTESFPEDEAGFPAQKQEEPSEPPAAVHAGNVYLRPEAMAVVLLRKLETGVILFRYVLA